MQFRKSRSNKTRNTYLIEERLQERYTSSTFSFQTITQVQSIKHANKLFDILDGDLYSWQELVVILD